MSATSRAGRPTSALYGAGKTSIADNHFAQDLGADLCIECGGFQLLVPEQDLDDADVDLLLEEVSGECVTQAVH